MSYMISHTLLNSCVLCLWRRIRSALGMFIGVKPSDLIWYLNRLQKKMKTIHGHTKSQLKNKKHLLLTIVFTYMFNYISFTFVDLRALFFFDNVMF
jgi:hypothetical protein